MNSLNTNVTSVPKMVVFDLDETLGYFKEFGILWISITKYFTNTVEKENILNQTFFNNLLDLFPEFLRPNIISILHYLKEKKEKSHCNKILIYTNNQGPKSWTEYIQKYFNEKLNYHLFEQIIGAFKINGKTNEACRSCTSKNVNDLIHCTKMPTNTQIVFIDDVLYKKMSDDNVYYVNVKPYIYCLSFEEIMTRILHSKLIDEYVVNNIDFKTNLLMLMKKYKFIYVEKPKMEQKIDMILSKKILEHLQNFFNKYYHYYTLKKNKKIKINKTRKKFFNE